MGQKRSRRQLQGEETRQRILDATIEIAAERGYEGTSMSQIADRAGVSMSSIYWHFADKDAVIAAVLERSHARWFADADAYHPPHDGSDPREHLATAVRSDIVRLVRHPEFLRLGLMLSLERRPSEPTARALFHQKREESLDRLEATFSRLLGNRIGADGDRTARHIATLMIAAADGLFIAHQVNPDALDLDALMDLLIGGIVDRVLVRAE